MLPPFDLKLEQVHIVFSDLKLVFSAPTFLAVMPARQSLRLRPVFKCLLCCLQKEWAEISGKKVIRIILNVQRILWEENKTFSAPLWAEREEEASFYLTNEEPDGEKCQIAWRPQKQRRAAEVENLTELSLRPSRETRRHIRHVWGSLTFSEAEASVEEQQTKQSICEGQKLECPPTRREERRSSAVAMDSSTSWSWRTGAGRWPLSSLQDVWFVLV